MIGHLSNHLSPITYHLMWEEMNDRFLVKRNQHLLIVKTRLANGLTVLMKEIHAADHQQLDLVQGRLAQTSLRGSPAHRIGYMLFKGTPTFPSTVLDKAISRKAAWNAMTFIDWTTFFETMPADKIDLGSRRGPCGQQLVRSGRS